MLGWGEGRMARSRVYLSDTSSDAAITTVVADASRESHRTAAITLAVTDDIYK